MPWLPAQDCRDAVAAGAGLPRCRGCRRRTAAMPWLPAQDCRDAVAAGAGGGVRGRRPPAKQARPLRCAGCPDAHRSDATRRCRGRTRRHPPAMRSRAAITRHAGRPPPAGNATRRRGRERGSCPTVDYGASPFVRIVNTVRIVSRQCCVLLPIDRGCPFTSNVPDVILTIMFCLILECLVAPIPVVTWLFVPGVRGHLTGGVTAPA
jgi:hypothetical protein